MWVAVSGVALLVAAWLLGPALLDDGLVGSPCAEAPPHLWGLWAVADGLWTHGPLVRVAEVGHPGGFREHLMDPVNMGFFAPLYALGGGGAEGARLAWNGMVLGWLVVGAAGVGLLGRRLFAPGGGRTAGAAVLAVGFLASSTALAFPLLGRTELLPAALMPLHLAFLHDALRGEQVRPGRLALAALTLGGVALGGGYLALFAAMVEVPAALLLARDLPRLRSLGRLVIVAVGALLTASPAAWALASAPPATHSLEDGLAPPSPFVDMSFALADALRLGGRTITLQAEQAGYVGVVLVAFAVAGAVVVPRARGWLALGLALSVLALGPFYTWDGVAPRPEAALLLPAGVLEWLVPPIRAMRSWSRLGCLAPLPLAVAAAYGSAALWERGGPVRIGVIVALPLMFSDQASWPRGWEPETPRVFQLDLPDGLTEVVAALPEGALLQLPLALDTLDGCQVFGPYLLWQRQHGRPISCEDTPARDGALSESWLARSAAHLQRRVAKGQPVMPVCPRDQACAVADLGQLELAGFAAVLHHGELAGSGEIGDWLDQLLGAPDASAGTVRAWRAGGEGESCPLPSLPWGSGR